MKDAAGFLQRLLESSARGNSSLDELPVARQRLTELHEGVNVEAVGPARRHTPGGGMRLLQVAEGLEVGHHIAERGAGDVELRPGQLVAPHRTAGRDVFANHGMQDRARALVEVFHETPEQMLGPSPGRYNQDGPP